MSQWMQVDGTLNGVVTDLSKEKTPQGSEGGELLERYYKKGYWMWHANLRDRGEEDVPAVRDWFADLCKRAQPIEANLVLDAGNRYYFEWDSAAQVLRLEIPPLYREAMMLPRGGDVTAHSHEPFYVIFDGPPGAYPAQFIECETAAGVGVRVGEWEAEQNREPWYRLGPFYDAEVVDELRAEMERLRTYADCLAHGLSDAEARGTAWPST